MEGGSGGEGAGELMIEYGPDAGRTPGDAGLRTSLLRMKRDEGGRARRQSDILLSNLAVGLCHT